MSSDQVAQHEAIQTEFAAYTGAKQEIKKTIDALKPLRPPTAPASDLAIERQSILAIVSKNLRVVQIALLTVLICLLEYVVLPAPFVHGLAFLTMCVGIGVGIYLSDI
jgi:hypothetical protein